MKIIDAILIVLILGIAVAYYFDKNRVGSCYKGQIQLTEDVKTFIDAEFAKADARPREVPGLKELSARVTEVEKSWAILAVLLEQNRTIFRDKIGAITASARRRKNADKETKDFVKELAQKVSATCNRGGPVK